MNRSWCENELRKKVSFESDCLLRRGGLDQSNPKVLASSPAPRPVARSASWKRPWRVRVLHPAHAAMLARVRACIDRLSPDIEDYRAPAVAGPVMVL
jgi:hypothetical protein